jgi:hypothetical protein
VRLVKRRKAHAPADPGERAGAAEEVAGEADESLGAGLPAADDCNPPTADVRALVQQMRDVKEAGP